MFFAYNLKRRATGIMLSLGLAGVIMILSACSSTTATSSAGATTAIPGGSSVATATTASASGACTGLDAIFQAAQGGKAIGFNLSAQPTTVVHGSLTTYTPGASASLSGTGYLVSPNDKVTIQLANAAPAVTIAITDTVTNQTTTYTTSACAATSSTILALTGTVPTSFTASLSTAAS